MTTQPETAVGSESTPAAENPADAFTRLAEEEFGITDEPEEEQPAEGEEPTAEDDAEVEEEADDLPPIDAPVSWDAEAKEVFKTLPRDAQEIVQKREAEREKFVQSKSQEATRAKSEAEQAAIQQLAQIERGYADQYAQIAQRFDVPEPDVSLIATDPVSYAMQAKQYQAAQAQRNQAQQTAQYYAEQAKLRETQVQQAEHAEQSRIIVENFPEYADPTTGPKIQQELSAVAKELGYSPELISQARATDILAMRKVAELKAKADKYDGLQSQKMAKVRAAKGLPRVATPGVAQGSEQLRARTAQSALETAKSSKDRNVQGAAFFDYLKNTGQI